MSFISGLYFRGDPKQKPKQWGPVSVVNALVIQRLRDWYGICSSDIDFLLCFWSPGNQRSLVNSISWSNTAAIFKNNALYFDGLTSKLVNYYTLTPSYTMTVVAHITPKAISNNHCIIGDVNSSNNGFAIILDNLDYTTNNTNCIVFRNGISLPNGTSIASQSNTISINKSFGITISGNTRLGEDALNKIFINGELNTQGNDLSDITASSYILQPGSKIDIGKSGGFLGTAPFKGYIDFLAYFNVSVSDDVSAKLSTNINSLLKPPTFRTYFDLSAQSALSITDTPDLIDIISSPILGLESASGLDSCYSSVVLASPLPDIDAGTALDMAWIANASGLPIECILGNILFDPAQLANAVGVISQATGIGITNDICSVTPISASALINAGYAAAFDASVMGLSNGYVLSGGETGASTDVAVLANASATAIAAMIGNSMLDSAMLAQAGVVILDARETAIANGYGSMITVPSVVLVSNEQAAAVEASVVAGVTGWVIPGVEVMSVADYAVLAASQGLAVEAFETLVLTDPSSITMVNAWMLTAATATDHDINAIFGTPVLVPVLSGRPVLQNKLQGTPLIIRS